MGNAHGEIHWTELNSHEPAKAAAFCTQVLGWQVQEVDMGGGQPYRLVMRGEEMVAGIFAMEGPEFEGVADQWVTYFAVDDADKSVAEITAAGGKVLRAPFDVPEAGRVAMVMDATGAIFGVMTPAEGA
ncbi:MAG: VOC family protein [Pseudomonadota bacterium]